MKKEIFYYLLLLLPAFVLLSGCREAKPGTAAQGQPSRVENDTSVEKVQPPAASTKTLLLEKAAGIVSAIATKDYSRLASQAHPKGGLRFSPYPYIDTASHQQLDRLAITLMAKANESLYWGKQDGTGNPIRLKFDDYYQKFIYNKPYLDADTIGYDEVVGGGNAIYNYKEVYPGSIMVEYFIAGGNPDFGGMDWGSLIMIFVEYEGSWYLRNLGHGQWTS